MREGKPRVGTAAAGLACERDVGPNAVVVARPYSGRTNSQWESGAGWAAEKPVGRSAQCYKLTPRFRPLGVVVTNRYTDL